MNLVKIVTTTVILYFASNHLNACILREGDKIPSATIPLKYENRRANVSYHSDLLQIALDKTADLYGPCKAKVTDLYLPSTRLNLHSVENGLVDVADTTTSAERDKRLRPIRIPLLKGLMGHRIFFIRKGDQNRFSKIKTVKQLRTFSFGQGAEWPDNKILRANGLKVVTSINHHSLLKMLQAGRFDAYPRGAQQVLVERKNSPYPSLDIEKQLVIAYVSPVYFHVANHNVVLASRLLKGLNLAIEDGEFDQLFQTHPLVKDILNTLKIANRHYIYLCNPGLNKATPIDRTELWWRPWPKDKISCQNPADV